MRAEIALLLALASCARPSRPPETAPEDALRIDGHRVTVFEDEKRGVTCWLAHGMYDTGISCLPKGALRYGK